MKILGEPAVVDGKQRIRAVEGTLNIDQAVRYANIRASIRRGLTQVREYALQSQEICLVGSGPSLEATLPELRAKAWAGCPIVAMNGSYQWLIDRNIKPTSMVMIDGRPFNGRFLTEHVPGCSYFLASQCDPSVFDRVAGWPQTFIWHCLTGDDAVEKDILDDFYLKCWRPIAGGCTVGTRAIVLFRVLGFQRMHVFGMDSCYMDGRGHALAQPENDADGADAIYCAGRRFLCSAWHISQALEFMQLVDHAGTQFELAMHGDGLLAHIVREGAADEVQSQIRDRREAEGA